MNKEDITRLSQSAETIYLISTIYQQQRIFNTKDYQDWLIFFRRIRGLFDKQKQVDLKKISARYQVRVETIDDLNKLIFVLESYYVFILKSLAFKALNPMGKYIWAGNEWFAAKGLLNYNIDSAYSFDINSLDERISHQAEEIYDRYIRHLDLQSNFDFVRELYEDLFDKRIRHSVGEFFTPDWLASLVVEETVGNIEIKDKSFLDPSCGSGTFIRQLMKKYAPQTKGNIFQKIYGIDINPVSVFAAKTNYLIEYLHYFGHPLKTPLELPIYRADVIHEVDYENPLPISTKVRLTDKIGQVDFIVGNPPWVNWEYLPTDYKKHTAKAWKFFQLYEGKGLDSNFLKEDISCLITYVVLYKYLKNGGKLGFLMKESLLKSVKQAKSFRKFIMAPTSENIAVNKVIDLTNLRPFEGINPRTIALFLSKGSKTRYPFDYLILKTKNNKSTFAIDTTLEELRPIFYFTGLKAEPSDEDDPSSPLKTLDSDSMKASKKISGNSYYKARTGVFSGGANAVFWLDIVGREEKGIIIQNKTERAKNKAQVITKTIEDNYVFPFVTGSDLRLWHYSYNKYILCPHTRESKMHPIDLQALAALPETKEYLEFFKPALLKRKGFTGLDKHIHEKYFYALQRIGDYTFSRYKVAWKYISKSFTPVVIEDVVDKTLGPKTCIPNEKVIYIGLDDKAEAYYLCGLLSADLFARTIESFMIGTQITPSLISKLKLTQFDPANEMHQKISAYCQAGHQHQEEINHSLKKINELVSGCYL